MADMKKEKLSTWKSIQKKYPDEWVLLKNPVVDKSQWIKKGIVVAHAKTRRELHYINMALKLHTAACLYTGELVPNNFVLML